MVALSIGAGRTKGAHKNAGSSIVGPPAIQPWEPQTTSSHRFVGIDRGNNLAELLEDLTSLIVETRGSSVAIDPLQPLDLDSSGLVPLTGCILRDLLVLS